MAWTTFGNLTQDSTVSLDTNFTTLSNLVPIPCTVVGTNTLVLTSVANAAAISAYQQNMTLIGIVASTSSGAVTAALGALAALPVYIDTQFGPAALTGGELVQNTAFALRFDQALNSGGGGFHLLTGAAEVLTQSLTVAALTSALVTGTSIVATSLSLGGNLIPTIPATLATITYGTLGPQQSLDTTVLLTGVNLFDPILLGYSLALPASLVLQAFALATGSVGIRAYNPLSGVTLSAFTLNLRVAALGY